MNPSGEFVRCSSCGRPALLRQDGTRTAAERLLRSEVPDSFLVAADVVDHPTEEGGAA